MIGLLNHPSEFNFFEVLLLYLLLFAQLSTHRVSLFFLIQVAGGQLRRAPEGLHHFLFVVNKVLAVKHWLLVSAGSVLRIVIIINLIILLPLEQGLGGYEVSLLLEGSALELIPQTVGFGGWFFSWFSL